MKASPFLLESESGKSGYTKLFACISEEEDGYMVQVRLSDEMNPENSAWGEEIVDSFETASELVAALAGEFSIEQACITIEIRMHNHEHGTRYRPTPAGRVSLWGPLGIAFCPNFEFGSNNRE
jgi:hypothetical protein